MSQSLKVKIDWGKFRPVDGVKFTPEDFCETVDGGQAFTWQKSEIFDPSEPEYVGTFGKILAKLRLSADGSALAAFPKTLDTDASMRAVSEYLDAGTDYSDMRAALAAIPDERLRRALEIYPTLRILRQNPREALICFICSSSKRIVQIKQCVRLLSEKLGEEICGGYHSLPDFPKIADAQNEVLASCKLGFRAAYLKKSSAKIRADKFDAMSLRTLDYESAKTYLTSLSGVGDKVADCILLFGASRFEAFPVDTWIRKAMDSMYSTGENPKKIRSFAAARFGGGAGFAQQLIFAAIRNGHI